MPELPDVEIFRRYLNATALHKKINSTEVLEKRILESPLSQFEKLKNNSFTGTRRHGKHLFVETSGRYLLRLHFGMTGSLQYFKRDGKLLSHARLLFNFTNGYTLAFINQRLLGHVSIEESIDEFIKRKKLGKDALEISLDEFKQISKSTTKAIKSLLMDQNKIAGLGNIYADEVLYQSRIHPANTSKKLKDGQIREIYRNIVEVLNYAIKHKANPNEFSKSYLLPHRSEDGTCPRCNSKLKRIKISGRTSYFCPKWQKQ